MFDLDKYNSELLIKQQEGEPHQFWKSLKSAFVYGVPATISGIALGQLIWWLIKPLVL